MTEVKPGQVWADKDKRRKGRTIIVLAAIGRGHESYIVARGQQSGLTSLIRLRLYTQRYRLLRDEHGNDVEVKE